MFFGFIQNLFSSSVNTPIKAMEQLCTRMWHPDARKSYICLSFHFCHFWQGSWLHTPTVISSLLSGQISLSDIDLCWVTLFFPIRPLLGLMTWKWIDELPALISLLKPAHHWLWFGLPRCAQLGQTGAGPVVSR